MSSLRTQYASFMNLVLKFILPAEASDESLWSAITGRENTMQYDKPEDNASLCQSTICAEDEAQLDDGRNALFKGVLLPCGLILVVLLVLLIAVLVS